MRWARNFLLGVAALTIATAGIVAAFLQAIWSLFLFEEFKAQAFYAERPLLAAMRSGTETSMTRALLDRVPPGTKRSDTNAVMVSEKIECSRPRGLLQQHLLVCGARGRPCSVPHWLIELSFDDQDEFRTGRVITLKATCET